MRVIERLHWRPPRAWAMYSLTLLVMGNWLLWSVLSLPGWWVVGWAWAGALAQTYNTVARLGRRWRRPDYARIARLERELGIEGAPPEEPPPQTLREQLVAAMARDQMRVRWRLGAVIPSDARITVQADGRVYLAGSVVGRVAEDEDEDEIAPSVDDDDDDAWEWDNVREPIDVVEGGTASRECADANDEECNGNVFADARWQDCGCLCHWWNWPEDA